MFIPENTHKVNNCCIIILAAGLSARLGSPKQLLPYHGKNLLQHSINSAKASKAKPILLVLGANRELIKNEIDTRDLLIIENKNWESGMASSVYCGINALKEISPVADAVILMVCDQPFVSATLLNNLLLKQKETGKAIVASSYENTTGTPVLFHHSLFPELATLKGDSGAKKLLLKYESLLAAVPFVRGGIDIDTGEDYKKLVK